MLVLHQKLVAYELEKNKQLVTDVSPLQNPELFRQENARIKHFDEYKQQGIDAAVTDVQYRNGPSAS